MKMKTSFGKILIFLIVLNMVNCVTVPLQLENNNIPITFSDIPSFPSKEKFEVTETYWYWFGIPLGKSKTAQEILFMEVDKIPGGKGIKKLRVKGYNKTWNSYTFLPNPFGIVLSTFTAVIGSALGFSNKSFYFYGEVY